MSFLYGYGKVAAQRGNAHRTSMPDLSHTGSTPGYGKPLDGQVNQNEAPQGTANAQLYVVCQHRDVR
ncbi:hypothetical protein ACXR8U_33035 (plasmid) [Methylobacterium radiotolerans]